MYDVDMFIVGKDKTKIYALKKALSKSYPMKNLGVLKKVSRMFWMSQEDYIKKVFERFNMQNTQLVHVPRPDHLKHSKIMSRE